MTMTRGDRKVRDLMTFDPVVFGPDDRVGEAAKAMRDRGIGAVIVAEGADLLGIVTDRDVVVRLVAAGQDASRAALREALSADDLATVSPEDPIVQAVELMREKEVRRLPVVDGGRPVGVLALSDVVSVDAPDSILADVRDAPPNA